MPEHQGSSFVVSCLQTKHVLIPHISAAISSPQSSPYPAVSLFRVLSKAKSQNKPILPQVASFGYLITAEKSN